MNIIITFRGNSQSLSSLVLELVRGQEEGGGKLAKIWETLNQSGHGRKVELVLDNDEVRGV